MKFYRLKELCTDIIDCPHSTPKWLDKGIPVIRNYNLNNRGIDTTNLSFVDEETYVQRIKRAKPEAGDIIISREAPMGVVGMIPENFKCCLGQRLVLLKIDKQKCNPKYLLYSLTSQFVQQQIKRIDLTGSIVSNLNIPDLKNLLIPVIEKQQNECAHLLDLIDSKIENNNKINTELESMAKNIYDYWFLQFEFPNKGGNAYKSSGGKMVWNEKLKREIPEGWTVAKLDDIAEMVTKSINPKKDQKYQYYSIPSFDETGTPIIESGENIDSNKYCVPNDAILVSKLNPQFKRLWYVGNTTEDSICSTEFIPFTSRNNTKEFLYSVLNSDSFYKFMVQSSSSSTGSRKRMQPELMKSFTLCYPSDEKIIYKYCKAVKDMFEKIIEGKKENQELASLRNFLLPLLMNGQVGFKE